MVIFLLMAAGIVGGATNEDIRGKVPVPSDLYLEGFVVDSVRRLITPSTITHTVSLVATIKLLPKSPARLSNCLGVTTVRELLILGRSFFFCSRISLDSIFLAFTQVMADYIGLLSHKLMQVIRTFLY